jgi:hypothetical protein
MTEEELLIEAKRRYPIGTIFRSPEDNCTYNTTDQGFYTHNSILQGLVALAKQECGNGEYIYYNDRWAEIISLPTPKITQQQKQKILDLINEI